MDGNDDIVFDAEVSMQQLISDTMDYPPTIDFTRCDDRGNVNSVISNLELEADLSYILQNAIIDTDKKKANKFESDEDEVESSDDEEDVKITLIKDKNTPKDVVILSSSEDENDSVRQKRNQLNLTDENIVNSLLCDLIKKTVKLSRGNGDVDSLLRSSDDSESENVDVVELNKIKEREQRVVDSVPRVQDEVLPEEIEVELEDIVLSTSDHLSQIGIISGVVDKMVVVKSNNDAPALDCESAFFLEDRTFVGRVFDTFGPVKIPYYTINLPKSLDSNKVSVGTKICHVPFNENLTKYVFVAQLKKMKGSDASWRNDCEPPVNCIEYSDDEEERQAKRELKNKKAGQNNQNETNLVSPSKHTKTLSVTSNNHNRDRQNKGESNYKEKQNNRFTQQSPNRHNLQPKHVSPLSNPGQPLNVNFRSGNMQNQPLMPGPPSMPRPPLTQSPNIMQPQNMNIQQPNLNMHQQNKNIPPQNMNQPHNLNMPPQNMNMSQHNIKMPSQKINGQLQNQQQNINMPSQSMNIQQGNTNMPPQNMNMPPQNMNMPPQNMNMAPQNMNMPPQNMNIPPQNMNMPPQNMNMQPQNMNTQPPNINICQGNMNMQPQNINMPAQNMNMPPQNMNMPPRNTNMPPQNMNMPPQNMNMPPQNMNLPPQNTNIRQNMNMPPQNMNIQQGNMNIPSQNMNMQTQNMNMYRPNINRQPQQNINIQSQHPPCSTQFQNNTFSAQNQQSFHNNNQQVFNNHQTNQFMQQNRPMFQNNGGLNNQMGSNMQHNSQMGPPHPQQNNQIGPPHMQQNSLIGPPNIQQHNQMGPPHMQQNQMGASNMQSNDVLRLNGFTFRL